MKPEENDSQQEIIRRKSTKKALNVMKKILAGGPVRFQAAKGHQEGLLPGASTAGGAGPLTGQSRALGVRPRAARMHRGTADYSTTLPPDTCAQRNRPPVPGFTAVGGGDGPRQVTCRRQAARTRRDQTPQEGREGARPDHPEASGWDADGCDKGAGGGGLGRGDSGRDELPGAEPKEAGWTQQSPCPGDGWQGLTGLRSALLHAHEVPGRARKGPLLPPPPLATRSAPRTPAGPTSIGAGSPGRAHPQPPACAQASCLGAAAQGPLPCWQGPARHTVAEGEHASLPVRACSALHLSLGPHRLRTTLYQPSSTQQTTHPR